jgi:hypothetical protein
MKMAFVGSMARSVPSKMKRCTPAAMARWMVRICCATTESTSRSMRLNSSKHAHAPAAATPLKNLAIAR